jgi:hypothetical protein
VALRSEIEALRTKTREQAAVISRLQSAVSTSAGQRSDRGAGAGMAAPANGQARDGQTRDRAEDVAAPASPVQVNMSDEINRPRKDLVDAENALRSARGMAEAGHAGQTALEAEIRTLKTVNQDQSAEVARLKAALSIYEAEDADDKALKESKVAMRARLSALQAQSHENSSTIQRLRAEIAAANEKLARQAAHFMDEMRRLGAGTVPTTGSKRETTLGRPKQALVDRINAPRPPRPAQEVSAAAAKRDGNDSARVSGFLRALDGATSPAQQRETPNGSDPGRPAPQAAAPNGEAPKKTDRRASLIERITRAEKPVA